MIARFLSKRRRGALSLVALAGMVPVAAMTSANLNTSQMIDDRRQVQDAADALATMHGAWSARALNIISMNNVTAAQLLSVAVGSEALILTTTELTAAAAIAQFEIGEHAGDHCPTRLPYPFNVAEAVVWTTPCFSYHALLAGPAALAQARAADIKSDFDPIGGLLTATKALEAIDGMNKALMARHPRAMDEISRGYHDLLDIDDHHFADPCNGQGVENCSTTNSSDGMALPLEPAEIGPLGGFAKLALVMEVGMTSTDTTFETRGFESFEGPLRAGGTDQFPALEDHINHVTEIGDALHEFHHFYQSRNSHMPRHPLAFWGSGQFVFFTPPADRALPPRRFVDREHNLADTIRDIAETVDDINQIIFAIARNIPQPIFSWDVHDENGYFPITGDNQRRAGPNAYTFFYRAAHASVMVGPNRGKVPIDFDLFGGRGVIYAAPVPETWQLPGIAPLNPAPPLETETMDEEFHILAFVQKEVAKRLGTAVLTSDVDSHTGYGQAAIYNPDGATLYSQNWQSRLMPSTRLDDPGQASRALDRQGTASFDGLSEDLGHVASTASWGRVNAH
ncbi:MAG: hypothetical protein AAF871_02530 [Pseudomonadota bacterium]